MAAADPPDYARSEHAEIIGYLDASGEWRYIGDDDWRPPSDDDLVFGDKYLIRIDTTDGPENMPDVVQWIGPIDGISLEDIYDYYIGVYEELAG